MLLFKVFCTKELFIRVDLAYSRNRCDVFNI
uniref:Uncharacterized protein n=1 Tax=Arundo donax TaxID=35708 RepID=A0A0A8Y5Y8_ARUDO